MAVKRLRLAARRKATGHSQEQLAEHLRVERSTVARWEAGETVPQPWFRPRIARALRVSLDDLDELLADVEKGRPDGSSVERPDPADGLRTVDVPAGTVDDAEHDPVVSAPWSHRGTVTASVALSGGGGPVERRTFLFLGGAALTAPAHQWLVREPGPLVSASSGGRVPAVLVDRLPAMIAELRTLDDAAGGGAVLSLARHNVGWVSGLLDQASYDERTGRALHVALAEFGQLAGWAADDAGCQGLAQRYYLVALHAAHSADDRPLGAHILRCMAVQAARYDRPAEAVTLIETALVGARGQETPSLLAELYLQQALALATLNDAPGCIAAISKARTAVEQIIPGDDPPWLYWVNPAMITAGPGDACCDWGKSIARQSCSRTASPCTIRPSSVTGRPSRPAWPTRWPGQDRSATSTPPPAEA